MVKTKIFFGAHCLGGNTADEQFNSWIEENPNIEILCFRYQQARYGDHSICILYREAIPISQPAPTVPAWQPTPPQHYDQWPPRDAPAPTSPPWVEAPIVTCREDISQ